MTTRTVVVRLSPSHNEIAKEMARDRQVSKEKLVSELLTEYAAGPSGPPPPRLAKGRLVEVRAAVTDEVYEAALARAKQEGRRALSGAVKWMIEEGEMVADFLVHLDRIPDRGDSR